MPQRFPEFTEDVEVISKLGDTPGTDDNLSSDQLKAKFDQAPKAIKAYLVQLVRILEDMFSNDGGAVSGGTLTGDLNINLFALTGLREPSGKSDATNKEYVDNGLKGKMDLSGGTFTGEVRMGGNALKGLPSPLTSSEPTTKEYVDGKRLTMAAMLGTGWAGDGPYTQFLAVAGIRASDFPHITPVYDQQAETALSQRESWGCVSAGVAQDGGILFTCLEDKPETAIPVQIEVMR